MREYFLILSYWHEFGNASGLSLDSCLYLYSDLIGLSGSRHMIMLYTILGLIGTYLARKRFLDLL